ncbi:transporter substrate-binding domain-containing protein [Streptomyces fulvoviolaceus]|uniref:transporter substrate-binding domain-containing protein n=1 Tax=Streptomyces fulvoviolaceus TaxID=285535 RepID=UPI0004CB9184|nr:transporter substrate-binding domain-containing protein [Streptomyces fulvoviolaceus]MCT9077091.1 transporter substrate-binding domain-containing protein [Streptomyces fulvoviolaceus]
MALTKQSRYTFYVVGVLILAWLAGYFGGKAGSDGGSTETVASSGDSAKAAWVDKIKKAGVLRVGCADAPPTIVVKTDGTCTGPDLIPLQNFADGIGVKVKTVATTWQNIVAGLQADKYDVAADLDQTVERSLAIRFTHGSWSYPGVFLAQRDSDYGTSKQILDANKPIATTQGSALDAALQQAGAKELRVDTYQNAAAGVKAGKAIAIFADLGTAVDMATKDKSLGIVVPNPAIFVHHVAYGVPAGIDARSMDILNVAIDNSVASGEIDRAFAEAGYRDIDALGDLEIKS